MLANLQRTSALIFKITKYIHTYIHIKYTANWELLLYSYECYNFSWEKLSQEKLYCTPVIELHCVFFLNLWMDKFSSPFLTPPFPAFPLPYLFTLFLAPPQSFTLLLSISSNKPIAESLCSSTLRLTSVSERGTEREGKMRVKWKKDREGEKERGGTARPFWGGKWRKKYETAGRSLFHLVQKESIREARLSMLLLVFFLFIS